MIQIKNLDIGYKNETKIKSFALNCINIEANSGELIALVGKNGSGKSTLLRTLACLQPAVNGEIRFNEIQSNKLNNKQLAQLLCFVYAENVNIHKLTVFDFISLGRFPHTNWFGVLKMPDIEIINNAMQSVGIAKLATKYINQISDGEQQRAMIARALAQDTQIIMLDEPTAFLDLENKYHLVELLRRLAHEKKKTIIFSTHDLNTALSRADKIWLIAQNRIYEGAPEDLVLNNVFSNIFDSTEFKFEKESGNFTFLHNNTKSIELHGEGLELFWTHKALQRIGYEIVEKSQIKIEILKNDTAKWLLDDKGRKETYNSIYQIITQLK